MISSTGVTNIMGARVSPVFNLWLEEVISGVRGFHAERRLQRWLEGCSLPPLDSHTEGHSWLLYAVHDVPSLRDKLAVLAARLLQTLHRQQLKSTNLDRLLFNLFYLCRSLERPRILWIPLMEILNATLTGHDVGNWKNHGFQGIRLVAAFRAALTGNQADGSLEWAWREMLQNQPHFFLDGVPMDGFEGILGIPGPPNEELIGWALARLASDFNGSPYRNQQLKGLLEKVQSRYATHQWDFGRMAQNHDWISWARMIASPSSVIDVEYADTDTTKCNEKVSAQGVVVVLTLPRGYEKLRSWLEPTIRKDAIDFLSTRLSLRYLAAYIDHTAAAVSRY